MRIKIYIYTIDFIFDDYQNKITKIYFIVFEKIFNKHFKLFDDFIELPAKYKYLYDEYKYLQSNKYLIYENIDLDIPFNLTDIIFANLKIAGIRWIHPTKK
ncbi:hypothetical protein [Spiroplasma endosymbiont of Aspidapion aeneum]|uniref:hypothetical protein n=1 Tax=Spiroplasma endosymbiont of Aspidapion aeneum TaxID=3066276 RepID=UPI00313E30E0